MSLVDAIILGLATWRISSLLVDERGPFDIFVWIRELTGIRHDKNKEVAEIPDGFFPQLFSCVWCASVWIGLFISVGYFMFWCTGILVDMLTTAGYFAFQNIVICVSFPFALSAMAIIFSRHTKG